MVFRRTRKKSSLIKRFFRSTISVIVLTAFVLSVSFLIKELSSFESSEIGGIPGDVAGAFVDRLSQTKIHRTDTTLSEAKNTQSSPNKIGGVAAERETEVIAKIAILADSHNDFDQLKSAVEKAQIQDTTFLVHLGDLSTHGDTGSLNQAFDILTKSSASWFALPGDRDLYASVGRDNFLQVFGTNYGVREVNGLKLVFLDNAAHNTLIEQTRIDWFLREVTDADFVFLSQPLWHSQEDRMMGVQSGKVNEDLRAQAEILLDGIRASSVKVVFSGEHHMSSVGHPLIITEDPVRPSLDHQSVGALVVRGNPQTPRFTMLTVYDNGNYHIEDIIL